jgi:hypothetical protein
MAKTSMIRELAVILGVPAECVISSLRDPTDFAGLPMPGPDGTQLEPPSWAKRLHALGAATNGAVQISTMLDPHWIKGLLFLDEVGDCAPATQAALARVVLEGVVGDLALPPGIRVVAAANPPEEAASGWDHNPAFANRWAYMVSHKVDRDPMMLVRWLRTRESAVARVPHVDPVRWNAEFKLTQELLAQFIERRPAAAEEDPKDYRGRYPKAFATWRTWESAARLHATCRAVDREELLLDMISGCVGEPLAIQYGAFVREVDLPNPRDLLLDPSLWTPDKKRPDRDFAVMLSVVAVATEAISGPDVEVPMAVRDRWMAAWRVIERALAAGGGKELVAVAVKGLGERRPKNGLLDPAIRKIIAQLTPVLHNAGVRTTNGTAA